MEGAGFQFILRVTNNGNLVPQVEGDMASLATGSVELGKSPRSLANFRSRLMNSFPFIGAIVGQKCPIAKSETCGM